MAAENSADGLQGAASGGAMSDIVIGLTGGIGCGKSTVADLFAAQGIAVVDTDLIAHELTGPAGAAMPEIVAAFGSGVVASQGGLDRAAMRRLAFADSAARQRLEGILHPRIRGEAERLCAQAMTPYVLLVVPLLIEAGVYRARVRRVLVVDCDEATQVSRVMARSGLTSDEVRAIMATQLSRAERLAAADDVVSNAGGREALEPQVLALHRDYLRLRYDDGRSNG